MKAIKFKKYRNLFGYKLDTGTSQCNKVAKTSHLLIVLTTGALLIISQAQAAVFV